MNEHTSPWSNRMVNALTPARALALGCLVLGCGADGKDHDAGGGGRTSTGGMGATSSGGNAGEDDTGGGAGMNGEGGSNGGSAGDAGTTGGSAGDDASGGTAGTSGEGGEGGADGDAGDGGVAGTGGTEASGGVGGAAGHAGSGGSGGKCGAGMAGATTAGVAGMGGPCGMPDGGFVVTGPGVLETDETGTAASFSLALNRRPSSSVTVIVRSSITESRIEGTVLRFDESRRFIAPLELTFTPDEWNVPKAITIRGVDDGLCDGDQSYVVDVFRTRSNDIFFDELDGPNVPALNRDDEPPSCPQPSGAPGDVIARSGSTSDHSEFAIDGYGNMVESVRFPPGPPYVVVRDAFGGSGAPRPITEFPQEDVDYLGQHSVDNDQMGFVYVVQRFTNDIQLGPYFLSGGEAGALYLAKYHPSGAILKAKQLVAPPDEPGPGTRVEAGALGHVLLVHPHTWELLDENFERMWELPAPFDARKTLDTEPWMSVDAMGQTHYLLGTVVFRIEPDGVTQMVVDVGAYGADHLMGIAAGALGDIYVVGDFFESLTVGDDSYTTTVPQAFVAKFDHDGRPFWASLPVGDTELAQVVVSRSGHIYVAGEKRGTGPLQPWPQYMERVDIFGESLWINTEWPSQIGTGHDRSLMAVHPFGQVIVMAEADPNDLDEGTIFKFAP